MIDWHRLFGLALTDYFEGSSYRVELEKDLSMKRQFVDVIIIEHQSGDASLDVPDGLEDLGAHNLLTYKSHQEALDAWTLDELLGHYVNYRKQASASMTHLLSPDVFRLYGVSTRYPQKLATSVTLSAVSDGVYHLMWGSRQIRMIVLSQIPPTEKNAIWHMFSAIPERVEYGLQHYHWHIPDLSTLAYELYRHYQSEGIVMSYTIQDYYKEFTREHLDWLPAEEILQRIQPDELLKFLLSDTVAERMSLDTLEQLLQQLRRKKQQQEE